MGTETTTATAPATPSARDIMEAIKAGAIKAGPTSGTETTDTAVPLAGLGTQQPSEQAKARSQSGDHADDSSDKRLADMTAEEQLAYWKSFSRKNERAFKETQAALAAQQEELEKLRQASMSDFEKQLVAARTEGAERARQEVLTQSAELALTMLLKGHGLSDDKVSSVMQFTDPARFVKNGMIDEGSLDQFVEMLAGAATTKPDMGQGRRGTPPQSNAVDEARAEAKRRGEHRSLINPAQQTQQF